MGSKADALTRDLGNSLADSIGVRQSHRGGTGPCPRPARRPHAAQERRIAADRSHLHRADQVRVETDPEADALLIESVRSVGLLQPVRVRWAGDSGKYCVVTGHRRLAAAVACGLDRVPVVVVEGTPTAAGIIEEQLIENLQRSALISARSKPRSSRSI